MEWAVKPSDVAILKPIYGHRRNSLQAVFGFHSGSPRCVFKPHAARKLASVPDNISPRPPDILFYPVVREVIDLPGRLERRSYAVLRVFRIV